MSPRDTGARAVPGRAPRSESCWPVARVCLLSVGRRDTGVAWRPSPHDNCLSAAPLTLSHTHTLTPRVCTHTHRPSPHDNELPFCSPIDSIFLSHTHIHTNTPQACVPTHTLYPEPVKSEPQAPCPSPLHSHACLPRGTFPTSLLVAVELGHLASVWLVPVQGSQVPVTSHDGSVLLGPSHLLSSLTW